MNLADKIATGQTEDWRPIPGYENYEASSLGNIRSLDRYLELIGRWGPMVRFHRGRVLTPRAKPPYGFLSVCTDGDRYLYVARGVALAFHGDPPSDEHEAAHANGDVANNRPGNLEWSTRLKISDNARQRGTLPIGSKNAMSRLVEAQIPSIIERYAAGESSHALAAEFAMTASEIVNIATGYTWSHVPSAMRAAAIERAKQNILEPLRREHRRKNRDAPGRRACAVRQQQPHPHA